MSLLKDHSHSFITILIVAVFSVFGLGIYALIGMSMFYIGREHSQAEYRYMKYHKINRSQFKGTDVFKKEAWNYDSLINDMILPIIVGFLVMQLVGYIV